MYMYICIYVYVCTCVYMHICIYIHVYTCTYVYMHMDTPASPGSLSECVCVYIYVHMHSRIYVCTYAFTYICIVYTYHMNMCTCVHTFIRTTLQRLPVLQCVAACCSVLQSAPARETIGRHSVHTPVLDVPPLCSASLQQKH